MPYPGLVAAPPLSASQSWRSAIQNNAKGCWDAGTMVESVIARIVNRDNELRPRSGLMLSQCPNTCRPLSACLTPLLVVENIKILDKKQRGGVWDSWNELGENETAGTNGV